MLLHFHKQRLEAILKLGLPIIGGMLSQSLLNLVDTAMVGSLGDVALAGVGIGGYANFIAIALILGLSSGVQAMVARRRGQGRDHDSAIPLNGGLMLAVMTCLPLMVLFTVFAEPLVGLISNDAAVLAVATPYFEYRILAMLAVGINLSFRGYWNGINHSLVYLRALIVVHILNVIISYVLIFGGLGIPAMGAEGAGLGTALSLYIGAILYTLITLKRAAGQGFLRGIPDAQTLKSMLRLSIPTSAQQFLFAASVASLFWIIGKLGVQELAVAHILTHLSLFLILPAVGLGMAATTLVSHALGRRNPDQASEWGWDVVKVASIILIVLSLPMWLFPEQILSLFIRDPELIALARLPLQLTALAICLDSAAIVFAQALLGAGDNRTVMLTTTLGQWLLYLPLAWLVGPYLGGGLLAIWWLQVAYRGLSSLVMSAIWAKRSWTRIRL